MGIGAGISAGLGAVMPIAQQDSQQGSQASLAAAENARLRELSAAEDKRVRDLTAAEDARMRELAAKDEQLKRDLSASDDARTRELAELEDKRQRELTAANIASNDRGNYAQAVTAMGSNYQQAISNTLQNDKIPSSTRSAAQSDIAGVYKAQQQQLATFYGVQLDWSTPSGTTSTSGALGAGVKVMRAARTTDVFGMVDLLVAQQARSRYAGAVDVDPVYARRLLAQAIQRNGGTTEGSN